MSHDQTKQWLKHAARLAASVVSGVLKIVFLPFVLIAFMFQGAVLFLDDLIWYLEQIGKRP